MEEFNEVEGAIARQGDREGRVPLQRPGRPKRGYEDQAGIYGVQDAFSWPHFTRVCYELYGLEAIPRVKR